LSLALALSINNKQHPFRIYLRVHDSRASSSKSAPSPLSLCYSLTHTHRSIGYRNIPQPLAGPASGSKLIYLRVYDSRVSSSKPAPSSLCLSLTHTHRSIGYRNIPQPLADSTARLIYLRVYDSRASSSKPAPSPLSLCYSLTLAHSIHTPPPPPPPRPRSSPSRALRSFGFLRV
jgi:hypothetical protein